MPIRLLFLLIFLPSTFLSSLNVSHVDALILFEPKPLGWNNRFFQASTERAPLISLLYNFKQSDSTSSYKVAFPEEAISALFPLGSSTERKSQDEQTNNDSEPDIPTNESTQSPENKPPVFSLQRRQITSRQSESTDDSTTSTRDNNSLNNNKKERTQNSANFLQETETNPNEARNLPDEERTSTPTVTNETVSSNNAPKNSTKVANFGKVEKSSNVELFDAGMKGAIIIGVASVLLGFLLIVRRIFIAKSPKEREPDVGTSNDTNNYVGGFDISDPLGGGKNWSRLDSVSGIPKTTKVEGLTRTKSQAIHPVVRRASENTISLPSKVKVAKERSRRPPASQRGKGSSSENSSTRSDKSTRPLYKDGPPVIDLKF